MKIGKKILSAIFNKKFARYIASGASIAIVSCLVSIGVVKKDQQMIIRESVRQALELALEQAHKNIQVPNPDDTPIPDHVEMIEVKGLE